jgi:MFS family permease
MSARSSEAAAADPAYSRPWYMLSVITAVNAVNWADRQVVSILFPLIKQDLQLSDTQLGLIGGLAFSIIYAVASFVFGRAADYRVRRTIIALGLVIWSVATAVSGLALGFATLFLARFFTGAGESSLYPASMSLIAELFPAQGRGRAMGIFGAAAAFGGGLGIIVGGPLAEAAGWRTVFFVYGSVGLLLAPLVMTVRERPRPRPSHGEPFGAVVGALIRDPRLLAVWASGMLMIASGLGYATWAPTFFHREHDMTLSQAGALFGVAALGGGLIGSVFGGFAADRWRTRRIAGELDVSRWAAFVGAPLAAVAVLTDVPLLYVVCGALAPIAIYAYFPPLQVMITEIVPARQLGVAYAINIVFMGGLGPALGPYLVGAISDATGSLRTAMLLPVFGMLLAGSLIARAGRVVRAQVPAVRAEVASV